MSRIAVLCAITLATGAMAQDAAEKPLSAIDWLSDSVRAPEVPPQSAPGHNLSTSGEAPIAGRVVTPTVTVTPLDSAGPRAVGTRLPADSGFPDDLWHASPADTLTQVISATPRAPIPALQDMVRRLMLTRAHGPLQNAPEDFTRARVDHLLEIGALNDAQSLLDAAGVTTPVLFRRYFDASLLRGNDEDACNIMALNPSVAPTFAARIFCLARGGDWSAAALTLGTARALGELSPEEEALMSHFLDPDLNEGEPIPPQDGLPSPLLFRVREAIGSPVPTAPLPAAFRVSDLRHHIGWKYQLEAAEALAAAGVLPASELLAIYSEGRPSASGGIWDRASAVQKIDAALQARDPDAVAAALPDLWRAMNTARVHVPLASLWAERLESLPLEGRAAEIAHNIRLLSPRYAQITDTGSLIDAIALGSEPQHSEHASPWETALSEAFTADATVPADLAQLAEQGRVGESLLRAVALFEAGREGDPRSARDAIVFLIHMGQEDIARRAAIQYLLLGEPA